MTSSNEVSLQDIVGGGYNDYWTTDKRYVVCKGSRGSKKSKTTALWMISHLVQYPLANALCVRRYQTTLRDSVYSDLKWAIHRLGLDRYFRCTVSPMEIVYVPTGQKVLFRGFDDAMKITSISVDKGVLCWVWLEEAYEVENEEEFNKLDMSIRGQLPDGYFNRLMLTFNPWSANSWIKARFFDKPDSKTFTKTTTWECNEWLSNDDRELFAEMKKSNPRRYRIEGEGEWGISQGLIYENVEMVDFDVDSLRGIGKAAFGLDFGFTDPNALVCMMLADDTIYVFDEWYETGCGNKDIAQQIQLMGYGGQQIVCDSAEPKSIHELKGYGIHAKSSRKGRDSVRHGIKQIQGYKIIVHPKCKNFYKEISNYAWEQDRNGRPTDTPAHEFSHGMDAMRYGIAKLLVAKAFSFN